jgi:hypothetical protein
MSLASELLNRACMIFSSVDFPEPFGPSADLGVGIEGEVDVLQHLLAAGEGLGQTLR